MELDIRTSEKVRSERRVRCYKVQQVDLESILKQVQILVSMEGSVMKFIIREGAVVVMKKIPGSDFYFLSWKLHELNYRLQSDYSTVLKFANTFKTVSIAHQDGSAETKRMLTKLLHKDSDHSNVIVIVCLLYIKMEVPKQREC